MDDAKKKTLELIEKQAHRMTDEERGKQLVIVARDYVVDGQRMRGVEVLRKIEPEYFEKTIVQQALEDAGLATAITDLCAEFEIADLALVARKPKGTS